MSFSINTDKVNSVADSISSLSSQVSSLASSIGGYDTSNEDGFDFAGAKSAIENNVKGMSTKFQNTVTLLTTVTGAHTALQESIDTGIDGDGETGNGNLNYYGGVSGRSRRSSTSTSSSSDLSANLAGYGLIDGASGLLASSGYLARDDGEYDAGDGETALNYASSALANTGLLQDENLSARELLEAELGTRSADAVSLLNENLDITLSSNNIQTVEADDFAVISRDNAVIIVEGHSQDSELNTYLNRVAKVAADYAIEVKYLKLDSIVEGNFEEVTSETTVISSTTVDVSEDTPKSGTISLTEPIANDIIVNTTSIDENDKSIDSETVVLETESNLDGIKALDDTELKDADKEIVNESNEATLEYEEVTENEKVKTNGSSETGTAIKEPSKILNQEEYDKLTKINTTSKKNDVLNGPVTLILKNNAILSSMNGYLTEMTIRSMLQLAGITTKTV